MKVLVEDSVTTGYMQDSLIPFKTLLIHFKILSPLWVLTGYYVCVLEQLEVKKQKEIEPRKGGKITYKKFFSYKKKSVISHD